MLSCIKSIVILYNFLFWLLGVLILGFSSYLWWDSQNYLDINEVSEVYLAPFVVLLLLGGVMTVIGFIACCGAIRESRCLLGMYFLFCFALCIGCGAFLVWAIQNEDVVKLRIRKDTSKLIKMNYGSGKTNATEMLVDRIQRDFTCCGIIGPEDWISSHYNNINSSTHFERGISAYLPEQGSYRIPQSCCSSEASSCQARVQRVRNTERWKDIEGLNTDGCIDKFEKFIHDKWQLIVLIGGLLIGVQVFSLLFACFLCCAISRQDK